MRNSDGEAGLIASVVRAALHVRLFSVLISLCVASSTLAAVPPSLQQRTQDPEVESVIKTLETKAAAVTSGTWNLSSGVIDQAATAFITGSGTSGWYFSDADGKELIFSDGSEFFEPASYRRYLLDTIEQGRRGLGQGIGLVHANLHPRQFLGVHPLKNLGTVTVDGANFTDLAALLKQDAATAADVYVSKLPRVVRIDYYIDSTRQAISRITVKFGNQNIATANVTQWDAFGTTAQWPKKITWQRQDGTGKLLDKSVLTSVESFKAQEDPQVQASATTAKALAFYGGIPEDLRLPAFYNAAVTAEPQNLSAQVLLSQSRFMSGLTREGLEQAQAIEPKVDDAGRKTLWTVLTSAAAQSLRSASAIKEPQATVTVIHRLIDGGLTPEQWSFRATAVTEAWATLRIKAKVAEAEALDDTIISNVTRYGNKVALRILIVMMKQGTLVDKIEPALMLVMNSPLPAAGYSGTQQSSIIGILLSEAQGDRALKSINALKWDPSTPESAKAPVTFIQQLLALPQAELAEAQAGAKLLDQYNAAMTLAADKFTRLACQYYCVFDGMKAVRTGAAATQPVAPSAFVSASAQKPKAAEFWDQVISTLLVPRPSGPKELKATIAIASGLSQACEQQLNQPGYQSKVWLRIAEADIYNSRQFSPLAKLEYLNKAFATAPDDSNRLTALKAIANIYESVGQHDSAKQAVEGLASSLTTPAAKAAATSISGQIDTDKQAYAKVIAERNSKIESDRLSGRVTYLQERVAEATKQNKPAEEIASLQKVLDQTKKDLAALQTPASQ